LIFFFTGAEFVDSFSDDQRAFFVFNEETTEQIKVFLIKIHYLLKIFVVA